MKLSYVPPNAQRATGPTARRAPVVYLVDDDEAVRDSLTILLESHGMHVTAYESCADFLAGYVSKPNSCLVLDQHLPTMSGLDFLESHVPAQFRLPVIMISGRVDPGLRARALAAGAFIVLDKPFDEEVILAAIAKALSQSPGSVPVLD